MKPSHIFIVGLPRTGTKMLKNILENNPFERINISNENFYVGHSTPQFINPGIRKRLKKYGDLNVEHNLSKLVDDMFQAKFIGTYWKLLSQGRLNIDRQALFKNIKDSDKSERSIYQIIMKMHGGIKEPAILGDRTPSHLYHVPKLLEWFPNSKIIQTARDPRAIIASQLKRLLKRMNPGPAFLLIRSMYALIIVIYLTLSWNSAARRYFRYKKRYPHNYYLVKFEGILGNPEDEIMRLCDFLEMPYHPDMLSPDAVGSSYERDIRTGFDTETMYRWRSYLHPWVRKWINLSLHRHMTAFGYDTD